MFSAALVFRVPRILLAMPVSLKFSLVLLFLLGFSQVLELKLLSAKLTVSLSELR